MSVLINSVSVYDKKENNPPRRKHVENKPNISQGLFVDNKIVEDIRDYRLNKQFEKYPGIKLLMSEPDKKNERLSCIKQTLEMNEKALEESINKLNKILENIELMRTDPELYEIRRRKENQKEALKNLPEKISEELNKLPENFKNEYQEIKQSFEKKIKEIRFAIQEYGDFFE